MTFVDFCEKMLIALYQDGHQSNEWLSFAELQARYGLAADASWLSRAMNHLSAQRRVEGRELNGAPDTVVGRITGSGMAYIEGKYGSKDGVGVILDPVQQSTTLQPFFDEVATEVVHSSSWTGLPSNFELTQERQQRLVRDLDTAEQTLTGLHLSQEVHAQARAYIIAARCLAEAPDPPADLIWEMLNRANALAGIASLFVSILALFH